MIKIPGKQIQYVSKRKTFSVESLLKRTKVQYFTINPRLMTVECKYISMNDLFISCRKELASVCTLMVRFETNKFSFCKWVSSSDNIES